MWDAYLDGQLEQIRNYCETDVLNTLLIYLRFELMRGRLLRDEYQAEVLRVRDVLQAQGKTAFSGIPRGMGAVDVNAQRPTAACRGSRKQQRSPICLTKAAASRTSTARPCSSTMPCRAKWWSGSVVKRGSNFDEGRLLRVIEAVARSRRASLRTFRHVRWLRVATPSVEQQLQFKQRQLTEALTRIGKVTPRRNSAAAASGRLELSSPRATRGALGAEEGPHGRRLS